LFQAGVGRFFQSGSLLSNFNMQLFRGFTPNSFYETVYFFIFLKIMPSAKGGMQEVLILCRMEKINCFGRLGGSSIE
jgi:hypothetical protein